MEKWLLVMFAPILAVCIYLIAISYNVHPDTAPESIATIGWCKDIIKMFGTAVVSYVAGKGAGARAANSN